MRVVCNKWSPDLQSTLRFSPAVCVWSSLIQWWRDPWGLQRANESTSLFINITFALLITLFAYLSSNPSLWAVTRTHLANVIHLKVSLAGLHISDLSKSSSLGDTVTAAQTTQRRAQRECPRTVHERT